ncbi:Protein of unknown function, partial [Cotesia congregata]
MFFGAILYGCHDQDNNLVPCTGPYEIFNLQPQGKKVYKRRRTIEVEYEKDEIEENAQSKDLPSQEHDIYTQAIHKQNAVEMLQDQDAIQSQPIIVSPSQNNNTILSIEQQGGANMTQLRNFIKDIIKQEFRELKSHMEEMIVSETVKITENIKKELINTKNEGTSSSSTNQQSHSQGLNVIENLTPSQKNHLNLSETDRILIRPLQYQRCRDTLDKLEKNIDVIKMGVGVENIVAKPNGQIIIDVDRNKNREVFTAELKKTLGDNFKVSTAKKNLPKIKVIGLDKDLLQMEEKETQKSNHDNLKLILLNVCGLLRCKDELENWISSIRPDIISLTETHTTIDIPDNEISFKNYNMSRTDSENHRTGGVLTYVKKGINFKCTKTVSNEGTWLNIVNINVNNGLTICNLYRSPSSSVSKFCDTINKLIDELNENNNDLMIVGDFNIDVNNKVNYSKKLLNELELLGLKQQVHSQTRVTLTSETIIDLIFSNFTIIIIIKRFINRFVHLKVVNSR